MFDDAKFIDLLLAGRAREEEIDDYVQAWHEGSSKLPLAAHLGLSEDEYAAWVSDPEVLAGIVRSRQTANSSQSGEPVGLSRPEPIRSSRP